MPKQDKPSADKKKPQPAEGADAPKDAARTSGDTRSWSTVNKLPGGDARIAARRNLPSGPLGGLGRKTNRSRSS